MAGFLIIDEDLLGNNQFVTLMLSCLLRYPATHQRLFSVVIFADEGMLAPKNKLTMDSLKISTRHDYFVVDKKIQLSVIYESLKAKHFFNEKEKPLVLMLSRNTPVLTIAERLGWEVGSPIQCDGQLSNEREQIIYFFVRWCERVKNLNISMLCNRLRAVSMFFRPVVEPPKTKTKNNKCCSLM